jgi:hypothetical protein
MSESELRGVSSPERTIGVQELASWRPAKESPKPERQTAKPTFRAVTTGIACFCGERFGESQALEFMLHLRAEVGENLAQLERFRDSHRRASRKYAEKPETKQYRREWAKSHKGDVSAYQEKYRASPKGRQKVKRRNQLERKRRRTDQEWRDEQNRKARERKTRNAPLCACGCGERTAGGGFRQGHWARTEAGRANASEMGRSTWPAGT